jgi:hypothetical protein
MNAHVPLPDTSASDLVDLAWDLVCSAGVVVKIDRVNTEQGVQPCVSAQCVAGQHAFMLVPHGHDLVEVYWSEYDAEPELVGMATDVSSILTLARRVITDHAPLGRARRRWRRTG